MLSVKFGAEWAKVKTKNTRNSPFPFFLESKIIVGFLFVFIFHCMYRTTVLSVLALNISHSFLYHRSLNAHTNSHSDFSHPVSSYAQSHHTNASGFVSPSVVAALRCVSDEAITASPSEGRKNTVNALSRPLRLFYAVMLTAVCTSDRMFARPWLTGIPCDP